MAFKSVLLCVSALLMQSIFGQNIGCGCSSGSYNSGLSNSYGLSIGSGLSSNSAALSSGGDFFVTSVSPISPSGIAVASDIGLGGDLDITGALPFLSAVSFQGSYDTSGSGSVCYGCGDGCIGIDSVLVGSSGLSGVSGCGCRN